MRMTIIAAMATVSIGAMITGSAAMALATQDTTEGFERLTKTAADRIQMQCDWIAEQNTIAEIRLLDLSTRGFDGISSVEAPPNGSGQTIDNRVDGNGDGTVEVVGYYYAVIDGEAARVSYDGVVDFCGGEVDGYELNTNRKEAIR